MNKIETSFFFTELSYDKNNRITERKNGKSGREFLYNDIVIMNPFKRKNYNGTDMEIMSFI